MREASSVAKHNGRICCLLFPSLSLQAGHCFALYMGWFVFVCLLLFSLAAEVIGERASSGLWHCWQSPRVGVCVCVCDAR